MSDSSGPSAILGVLVGVLIVGGVIFFWANGTFSGKPATVDVNVPATTINVNPPAPATPAPAPAHAGGSTVGQKPDRFREMDTLAVDAPRQRT